MIVDVAVFILLLYFGFGTVYLFVLAVFSLLREKSFQPQINKLNRFAVLIPNYKENRIILDVAHSALNHDYPRGYFDVYVIADGVAPETIAKLKNTGCNVLEVQFENSTKARSLNSALSSIEQGKYDYTVVLDVDNIMQPGFLHQMNLVHNSGYKVVQGHRTAKNINTNTAYLDALSEESANSLIRRGIFRLGGSAMIIGSAFSIEWNLFRRLMSDILDVAGEDRELEIRILAERIKIAYCSTAVVLDEKVENWGNYTRQRSRWAAAHLDFVLKYFTKGFVQLFKGNLDYFNKVLHSLIPPRIILLGALSVFFILSLFISDFPFSEWWISVFVLYIATLMLSIPKRFYTKRMFAALLELPKMLLLMLLSWIKARGQRNRFVSTPHTYTGEKN